MAEVQSLIALRVEPRVAEVGRRLCISWTGDDVTEGHWIGLFPSGNKPSGSRVNVVRIILVLLCHFNMNNLLTPCPFYKEISLQHNYYSAIMSQLQESYIL